MSSTCEAIEEACVYTIETERMRAECGCSRIEAKSNMTFQIMRRLEHVLQFVLVSRATPGTNQSPTLLTCRAVHISMYFLFYQLCIALQILKHMLCMYRIHEGTHKNIKKKCVTIPGHGIKCLTLAAVSKISCSRSEALQKAEFH